jgi:N-acetylglucosaminyldiphosphoundecaprenol N-acetyl-beta-D-mannosaminyltransferase
MKTLNKTWPTTSLLSISVDCPNKTTLLEYLHACIQAKEQLHLVTMNAEMAYSACQDSEFRAVLNQADVVIPDGIGVVWALAKQGIKVQRLPGVELVEELLKEAPKTGLRWGLLGSSQATLEQLPQALASRIGPIEPVYLRNGFFSETEIPDILQDIAVAKPDILFVALGVPKQEFFISQWRKQLPVPILMGVGGSFDVLSGQLKRAPVWMQKNHLEWFYRLIQQPSRWRRMLSLPKFVLKVMFSRS